MHQYLDSDGSGTSEACVSSTIGQERIREATAWLKANGKRAILGETAGGANAQCIAALTGMLSYMASNSDVWTGWYVNPICAFFRLLFGLEKEEEGGESGFGLLPDYTVD
jgi:hypothetical protein